MDIAKEFRRYLKLVWSWSWLIILGALLAGGVNYYISSKAPAKYEANTTLMIGQLIRQANPDQQEIGLSDRLAVYYLELLRRQPVLEGVKKDLQLQISNEELAGKVAARVVPSTAFIEISVVDLDPTRAVQLTNSFAKELIKQSPTAPENQRKEQLEFIQKQMDELQTKIEDGRKKLADINQSLNTAATAAEIADARSQIKALEAQIDSWQTNYTSFLRLSSANSPNSINVLEESNQARRVKSVSPLISGLIAGAIGAVLALGCAILLEYLDDRLKTHDQIKERLKLSVLGHVPLLKDSAKISNWGNTKASQDAIQAYEIICTNVLFSDIFNDQRRSLMITTPATHDLQAQVSLNLAIAMVSFEQSVLLVDANVNKPELHQLLGAENQMGFFETFYGSGFVNLEDKVQETAVPNLYLMSAGNSSPDAQKLIVMRPGTQQIYDLPDQPIPGDFAIFHCGSVLSDKTARLLTSHTTATVLVCELNRTRNKEVKEAIEVVRRLKGTVLGVITIEGPGGLPKFMRVRVSRKKKDKDAASTDMANSDTSVA